MGRPLLTYKHKVKNGPAPPYIQIKFGINPWGVDRAPRSSVGSSADVVQPVRREASLSNDPGSTPIIEALAQVAAVAWEANAWAPNDVLRDFVGFLLAARYKHSSTAYRWLYFTTNMIW